MLVKQEEAVVAAEAAGKKEQADPEEAVEAEKSRFQRSLALSSDMERKN